MGKTCCVPKCRSGYRNVDMTGISMHSFKKHWKGKIPREGNWKVTKETGICSLHFRASDVVTTCLDTNSRRMRQKKGQLLAKPYIKKEAYPTVFPNCPSHLSKKEPPKRASMGSSDKRRSVAEKLNEEKGKREFDADTIQTLKDIEVRYQNPVFSVTNITVFKDELVFYKIEIDAKNLKPMIKYSLTITSDLQFQCYHSNIRILCCHFNDLGVRDSKINLFSQIELVLKKLDNMNDEQPDEDIEFYIENLRKYECKDASVRSKLDFLIEQIQIAFIIHQIFCQCVYYGKTLLRPCTDKFVMKGY